MKSALARRGVVPAVSRFPPVAAAVLNRHSRPFLSQFHPFPSPLLLLLLSTIEVSFAYVLQQPQLTPIRPSNYQTQTQHCPVQSVNHHIRFLSCSLYWQLARCPSVGDFLTCPTEHRTAHNSTCRSPGQRSWSTATRRTRRLSAYVVTFRMSSRHVVHCN